MFESLIESMPVRSRSILPTLSSTPTFAQSASFEQALVTLSNGEGRTTVPLPRSEQPLASGPHLPSPPLIGLWHLVASAPQPAQSASSWQTPLLASPHCLVQVPCAEQVSPAGQAKVAEHSA